MRERLTKVERHQQILQAAARLFKDRGYENVTIADVIAASNIARGTFYLHFTSLEDVLGKLFDKVVEDTWNRVAPLIQDETIPFKDCALAVLRAAFDIFSSEDGLGVIFGAGGGSLFQQKRQTALFDRLGGLIATAAADRLHGEIPRLEWIVAIVTSMVGEMAYYASTHETLREDAIARTAFTEQVIHFALAGLEQQLEPYIK